MTPVSRHKDSPLTGMNLFQPLDTAIWVLVLLFFGISAIVAGGNLILAFVGAAGIVVIMFLVGASIEVIIETLRDVKGLGTLVGFITNGPETLCLIVGLIAGDVLYAASTPLGSNVMNPLMLFVAALITRTLAKTAKTNPVFTIGCILITASLAVGFFFIPSSWHVAWVVASVGTTAVLFLKRPPEPSTIEENPGAMSKAWFAPAFLVLLVAGYLLDPVVTFTAENSRAPKGVIGFFVLATLTSWPEFKSTLSLLRRGNTLAAVLNITVSNITNIWLAVLGIIVHVAS